MKQYVIIDRMSNYIHSLGLYVNGFNMDRMDHYYFVQDDFGNLINVL